MNFVFINTKLNFSSQRITWTPSLWNEIEKKRDSHWWDWLELHVYEMILKTKENLTYNWKDQHKFHVYGMKLRLNDKTYLNSGLRSVDRVEGRQKAVGREHE